VTREEHISHAEAALTRAQQAKNTMAEEGDWEPVEVAAALQTIYAEAQVHATLALASAAPLPRIEILREPDRAVEIVVDGRTIASANHDEHGWSGMDAVEKTAAAVAQAFGGVVYEGDLDDDEHEGADDGADPDPDYGKDLDDEDDEGPF